MPAIKHIYINGRFLTQPITGVQRVAFQLVKALDDLIEAGAIDSNAYRFTLIYSGELLNTMDLKHILLIRKGYLTGNLWEQLELPWYTNGKLLVSLCSISSLIKCRQVVMVHDASFAVNPQFFSPVFRNWYKFAMRVIGRRSQKIVTVSEFSKLELAKYAGIPIKNIEVIPNAADHIKTYAEPSVEFKKEIAAYKPYCLGVSSLGKNKNFAGLSRALAQAEPSGHTTLIAGGAPRTLKATSAKGTQVKYLGYVSDEKLKYLYQNADLFVFPSFYEGFGIPPLEAMQLGCPVLASGTSAMPESLGDACVYCDPYDEADMASHISAILGSTEMRDKLRAKGYEQAAKYSWEMSAKKLFQLLERSAH